jgi:hypothetical protein
MTLEYAKRILEHPKFGDSHCIAARERLEREPECERLRALVIGKTITCGACGGDDAGCDCCEGGLVVITPELAESWDLDILKDVAAEVQFHAQ